MVPGTTHSSAIWTETIRPPGAQAGGRDQNGNASKLTTLRGEPVVEVKAEDDREGGRRGAAGDAGDKGWM